MRVSKFGISNLGPISQPLDLSFDLRVNVLIGPNGCGKSTIIRELYRAVAERPYLEMISESDQQADVPDAMGLGHYSDRRYDDASGTRRYNVDILRDEDKETSDRDNWYEIMIGSIYSDDPEAIEARTLENGDERPITVIQVDCEGFDGPFITLIPSVRLPFPNSSTIGSEYIAHTSRNVDEIPEVFLHTLGVLDNRNIFWENEKLSWKIRQFIRKATADELEEVARQLELRNLDVEFDPTVQLESLVENIKQSILRRTFDCATEICREVVRGDMPTKYDAYIRNERIERNSIHTLADMSVATSDNTDKPITVGDLSSGAQCLMWIWHIAMKLNGYFMELVGGWLGFDDRSRTMFDSGRLSFDAPYTRLSLVNDIGDPFPLVAQTDSGTPPDYLDEWWKLPFILVIDEIENHLHPTWQRRVIPALLEYFPNVQIIATTHSPFVVAGLKAGQVHLLNRDENGVVTVTTNTEDIGGWTADEILRTYMGVRDPTDKKTADAAAELRRLRDQGPQADERAEEERQAEIHRLRQMVDRAELSGPRVAEDDRFLSNLEAILERYRQSQDLSQENG